MLGEDATLCFPTRSGKLETTDLYRQLYEEAGDLKPANISIDTLTRAFAGNEIDRVQVHAFASHMQKLAMVTGGAVTVLSHPTLQGMASGSGLSGSTGWHNAFRFRHYLPADKNKPRELNFLKNQYGSLGETIILQYRNGLFLPIAAPGSLEKLAADQAAENLFLRAASVPVPPSGRSRP